MLYFSEREEPLSILESLPQIFAIEEAEASLFREYSGLMSEAGCWARFLHFLISRFDSAGEICGVEWRSSIQPVVVQDQGKVWSGRSARWIEVRICGQKFVAAFVPHVYETNGHPFLDHRFVIGCSDPKIVPLVVLFGDHILGLE